MAAPGLRNQIKAHINNFLKNRVSLRAIIHDLALKNDFRMRYTELKARYASAEDKEKAAASDCKSQPITLILAPVAGSNDPATGVNSS